MLFFLLSLWNPVAFWTWTWHIPGTLWLQCQHKSRSLLYLKKTISDNSTSYAANSHHYGQDPVTMIDRTLLNLEPKQTKAGGSLNKNERGRLFAVATHVPGLWVTLGEALTLTSQNKVQKTNGNWDLCNLRLVGLRVPHTFPGSNASL